MEIRVSQLLILRQPDPKEIKAYLKKLPPEVISRVFSLPLSTAPDSPEIRP